MEDEEDAEDAEDGDGKDTNGYLNKRTHSMSKGTFIQRSNLAVLNPLYSKIPMNGVDLEDYRYADTSGDNGASMTIPIGANKRKDGYSNVSMTPDEEGVGKLENTYNDNSV